MPLPGGRAGIGFTPGGTSSSVSWRWEAGYRRTVSACSPVVVNPGRFQQIGGVSADPLWHGGCERSMYPKKTVASEKETAHEHDDTARRRSCPETQGRLSGDPRHAAVSGRCVASVRSGAEHLPDDSRGARGCSLPAPGTERSVRASRG